MKLLLVAMLALPLVMGGSFEDMFGELLKKGDGDYDGGKDGGRGDKGGMDDWTGEYGGDKDKDEEYGFLDAFKKWMKGEQRRKEEEEKHKEAIKEHLAEFTKYLKKQKYKEEEEKKIKMALHKKMEYIKQKKDMIYDLQTMAENFAKQKLMLKFGIFSKLLYFCECDDGLQILYRLKNGTFGYGGMDGGMGGGNGTRGGNGGMGGDMGGDMDGDMEEYEKKSISEAAQYLRKMDKKERVKTIVKYGYKVMCGSARQFLKHLAQVEAKYRYLKEKYGKDHDKGDDGYKYDDM